MSEERYEIRGKLGEGGVGAVYRAFDTQLNREVAIKRVLADGGYENQEEATKHLLKEATALSSVQHPHIVTVYDAGVDEDGPYVVMELIHGKTLDEMVERGTLTWDDLREIALQSLEALIAAQDLDLVHRDLKPSNMMVCWLPSGKFQVKIVDFGLAKFSATPSLQTIDHGDAVFGSIFFMAPEQFERTPLDKRTDMYALGCLFYYSLTGQYPFTGDTAAAVMASHLQHHVTPLRDLRPDVPQWGADWIMWHIERSMDDRPADARAALERFLILDKQSTQPIAMTAQDAAQAPNAGAPKLLFPGTTPPAGETGGQNPARQPEAPVPMQNPGTAPQDVSAVNPQTAPQPIAPPQDSEGKVSPHTQAQKIAKTATAPVQPPPAAQPTASSQTSQVNLASSRQPAAPSAEPAPPAAAAPAVAIPAKKTGMPNGAKWAIVGMLVLVVAVAAVLGTKIMGDRKKTEMVNQVMVEAKALDDEGKLQDGIELNQEQLEGVLARATSTENNKQRPILLKVLAYAKPKGSFDINRAIIEHVTTAKCPENIRTEIFKTVMTRRPDIANVEPLLSFAKGSAESSAAAAAIEAARKSAVGQPADEFINDFLNLIKDTDSAPVRGAAERAAADLIAQAEDKKQFATPIVGAYEAALTADAKYAMLRLSGVVGGPEAAKAVKGALAGNDAALQNAAIAALGHWADDSEFETLTDFIDGTENEALRKKAFDSAYAFLRLPRKRGAEESGDLWRVLAGLARSQREKLQIIGGMANQKQEWAVPILEFFTEDDDDRIADKAEQAKEKLERRIRENEG